jgi:AraC-like DNA-binding protein
VARTRAGHATCRKALLHAHRRLAKNLKPQALGCFAGLADVAVPVVVAGAHVATLLGGQVLLRQPTPRQVHRLAGQLARWGLDGPLPRFETTFLRTPVVSPTRFRALVRLLTFFAEQLAGVVREQMLAASAGDPPAIARAKLYAHDHAAECLMIGDVARQVNLSTPHFSRTFKKRTGMSFTEYVTHLRVAKAKTLLLDGNLRVTDVAQAAGFESIPHFNRVFRRCVGQNPTAYRAAKRLPRDFQI